MLKVHTFNTEKYVNNSVAFRHDDLSKANQPNLIETKFVS